MDLDNEEFFRPKRRRDIASRSRTIGVNVVRNRRGTFINVFMDGVPANTHGPFDEHMSLAKALYYVSTLEALGE